MAEKDREASAKTALRRKLKNVDYAPTGIENQPIASVEWIPRDLIKSNEWNPNYVAPPEIRLLKISIISDGWTQPIVVCALPEADENGCLYEVIDGEHRFIISGDEQVLALTDGYVPVVVLRELDEEHRMMSTVRHNRARGSHHVLSMADIVATLHQRGVDEEIIGELMQMEVEEIQRFLDRGNMVKRGVADSEDFGKGWVPR